MLSIQTNSFFILDRAFDGRDVIFWIHVQCHFVADPIRPNLIVDFHDRNGFVLARRKGGKAPKPPP